MEAGTNEISATSKIPPHEVVSSGIAAGSRPTFPLGKADDIVEETGESTRCTAGVGDPASRGLPRKSHRIELRVAAGARHEVGVVSRFHDGAVFDHLGRVPAH